MFAFLAPRAIPGVEVVDVERRRYTRTIALDLAGNVSEYALDVWNLEREACWGSGVFIDPLCDVDRATPHGRTRHTVVGGSYGHLGLGLTAAYREEGGNFTAAMADETDGTFSALAFVQTGFRCARPAL